MPIPWLPIGMGLLSFGLGMAKANINRQMGYAKADEIDKTISDTLLTHKFNVGQQRKRLIGNAGKIRKRGAYVYAQTVANNERKQASRTSKASSSGAAIGEFTPMNVRVNMAGKEFMQAQMVKSNTKASIDTLEQDFIDWKQSADFQTSMSVSQMKRQSALTRKGADMGYVSDSLGAVGSGVNSYGMWKT